MTVDPSAAAALQLATALAPIVVVLALLVLRVPSLWAGAAGLASAVLGAALAFPVDAAQAEAAIGGMGPLVAEVAVILLGGVSLAEGMARSGAQDRIAAWLERAESGADRTVMLLLLVFGLTPVMESVTGFGLGVVITAPLLIRLGLTPVKAVVSGLLGLVLVPWGSLGPGTLVAAQLGGVGLDELGVWSALLTPVVLVVSMAAVLWLNVGRPTARQLALAAAVIVVETLALVAANALLGVPLAGIVAGAAVVALLLAVTRLEQGSLPPTTRALWLALVPYAVLCAGVLAATALLAATGWADALGWLASPAVWSVVAASVAIATAPSARAQRLALVRAALRRWVPIAGNAIVFMLLGIVMATAGMATHLASTAAQAGIGFVAAIPLIGALGGYLTGSNTGAAAMLSTATATSAASLGASPLVALAGQNVAGSFAIIASPPRIALAVGVALPAGERLPRRMLGVLVGAVAAASVVLGAVTLLLA